MDKAQLIRLMKLVEIPVMLIAAGGVMAGSITVLLELPFVMASMVVASVTTMGLLAAGVRVPALFR
jgi:hypothetical protein